MHSILFIRILINMNTCVIILFTAVLSQHGFLPSHGFYDSEAPTGTGADPGWPLAYLVTTDHAQDLDRSQQTRYC